MYGRGVVYKVRHNMSGWLLSASVPHSQAVRVNGALHAVRRKTVPRRNQSLADASACLCQAAEPKGIELPEFDMDAEHSYRDVALMAQVFAAP